MRSIVGLLIVGAALGVEALKMVVLHTNDMHSRIDEISQGGGSCRKSSKCYGGFARLKMEVERIRKANPNTLFLNGGDTFQGTPLFTVHKWRVIAKFIDMLGIDAMSLGNHEFDNGVEGLVDYLKAVRTPSVSCNIDTSLEPSFEGSNLHPWVNFTVDNTNIAVIGYITPDTKFLAKSGDVVFMDEVESIKKTAKVAKTAGAKIIIALGHSGYNIDLKIAQEVPDVDLVIGGHTNTFLYTGNPPDLEVPVSSYPHMVTQSSGKRVPVVQAFAFTKYLGYLQLEFDENHKLVSVEGNPILLKSSYPKDMGVEAELKIWKEEVIKRTSKEIGKTRVDLEGSCRQRECNMANLITDAWVDYAVSANLPQNGWTIGAIAMLNGGSVRAAIMKNETHGGEVTVGQVLTTMPFEGEVMLLTLSGTTLLEALEQSIWEYDTTGVIHKGSFLQVSGLKIIYDVSAEPGRRVVKVEARCAKCLVPKFEPLDPHANYSVIVSDYLAAGGDGVTALTKAYSKINLGETDTQIVINYIEKLQTVYPQLENRIILTQDAVSTSRFTSDASSHLPTLLTLLLSLLLVTSS